MIFRRIAGGLRLHQRGLSRIQIAARNRAFGKELLATLHDALVQVESGLGRGCIQFGPPRLFRHLRLGRSGVLGLRRHVQALAVERGRGQVARFERGQQLTRPHPRSALDVELPHWSADLRLDGRLGHRREHRMRGLYGYDGHRRGLLLAAGEENQEKRQDARQNRTRREKVRRAICVSTHLPLNLFLFRTAHSVPASVSRSARAVS